MIRDIVGNELNEGDLVSLAVGSEIGAGHIKKIDSGLGLQGGQPSQPYILIELLVQRPIVQGLNVAAGVLKVAKPAPQVTE